MNTLIRTSKDNLLMSALIATGLTMATIGPLLSNADPRSVIHSAARLVQSVSTPTAMQPLLKQEAAIIAVSPRHRSRA